MPTFQTLNAGGNTFADLKLQYDGDDPTMGMVYTLTKGGATDKCYMYVNEAAKEFFGGDCEVGWWFADDVSDENWENPQNALPMNAGDGIALVTGDSSIQLRVPSPLKKK